MNNETLRAIKSELAKARKQYPTNIDTLRVLELFTRRLHASLENDEEAIRIYSEAICVAVMAIRVAEEGDSKFRYASYVQQPGPLFRHFPKGDNDAK